MNADSGSDFPHAAELAVQPVEVDETEAGRTSRLCKVGVFRCEYGQR